MLPRKVYKVESIKSIGLRSFEAQLRPKQIRTVDIVLPDEVKELIQNPMYNNRYKWLQREDGEEFMIKVARYCTKLGKDKRRMFAWACSKAQIEKTVETIRKYYDKAEAIALAIKERPTVYANYIWKCAKTLSGERIRNALARSSDHINPGAGFVLLTKL